MALFLDYYSSMKLRQNLAALKLLPRSCTQITIGKGRMVVSKVYEQFLMTAVLCPPEEKLNSRAGISPF